MKYSKRPKSEHVRISDRRPSFGSNYRSVLKLTEIRTVLFGFRTFGWLTIHVRTFGFRIIDLTYAMNAEIRTINLFGLLCSNTVHTEQALVRISALSEIRTFGFWTFTVDDNFK